PYTLYLSSHPDLRHLHSFPTRRSSDLVDGLFSAAGLIPTGPRPSRDGIFGTIAVNYKLALNLLGVAIFTALFCLTAIVPKMPSRSEEHTSELQSRGHLVCRLLLEKKNK